jgi:hypothetical protein
MKPSLGIPLRHISRYGLGGQRKKGERAGGLNASNPIKEMFNLCK